MPVTLEALDSLLARMKRRATPPRWNAAVALAARAAITRVREDDEEVVLAVPMEGQAVPATVNLYTETEEWSCDCGGSDPCMHILAATSRMVDALRRGERLPIESAVRARLRYALSGRGKSLVCERMLVRADGSVSVVRGALGDLSEAVEAGDGDLALDRLVAVRDGLPLPDDRVDAALAALVRCDDVRVGDEAVRVDTTPMFPRVLVEARGEDVVLRVVRHAEVTATLSPAVARLGDVLRPVARVTVLGAAWSDLPRTRVVPRRDLATLVTETLPSLPEGVVVERRAALPAVSRALRARVDLGAVLLPHLLTLTPAIVYGDPPCARVEDGRLVYLRGDAPVRRPAEEVALTHKLRDELGLLSGVRSELRGDAVGVFLAKLRAWEGGGERARTLFGDKTLVPRFTARDDGFDLEFERPFDNGDEATAKADAATVVTAWRDGLEVVPLTDGTWAPLPAAWLREHGHRVADLLAARDRDGVVTRAALPALGEFCDALEQPRPAALEGLRALVDGFTALPTATLPGDLRATLRAYQQRGVDWLCLLRDARLGAVLADDMGLGKTLQTLCALRGRALVVSPRSVMDNWAAELARFRPSLRVCTYHGADRALDARADVTLTTYAVLRLDGDALAKQRWDIAVLDEAQAIKNPDSQTARAAYALRADWRVALSGTPVENRLDELWSLFHFTNPGLLGGRSDFDDRYGRPVAEGDATAAARLRARTRTFVMRRLKRDVARELPPRTEVVLRCELDARERAVYDAVRAAAQKDVAALLRDEGSTLAVLEALLRLRQAACHAGLVPGQTADASSKVTCLVDALEMAAEEGHRALVFSQWTGLLDRVEPHLRERGVGFTRLDGSTRDRAGVVAAFQSAAGAAVMLVSLKAGGTGLNLTAADHVFLLDPWWNPAVEDQAADRAHRIGQTRPVTVYRLVARDTVEERILTLQERKRALALAALDGEDPSASLTRDDLLSLLV